MSDGSRPLNALLAHIGNRTQRAGGWGDLLRLDKLLLLKEVQTADPLAASRAMNEVWTWLAQCPERHRELMQLCDSDENNHSKHPMFLDADPLRLYRHACQAFATCCAARWLQAPACDDARKEFLAWMSRACGIDPTAGLPATFAEFPWPATPLARLDGIWPSIPEMLEPPGTLETCRHNFWNRL